MATAKRTPKAQAAPADDRLRRDLAPAARGDRGVAEDAARANETGLTLDLDELQAVMASEFDQVALPTAPRIPGWHVCWLTTGSQYDSIQKRQRLGYIPVTAAEVPGFDAGGLKSAAFEGAVTCNEMVLFKIKEERYQAIMQLFHHKRPLDEEEGIYAQILEQTSSQDKSGKTLAKPEGDGFTQLGRNIERAKSGAPVF